MLLRREQPLTLFTELRGLRFHGSKVVREASQKVEGRRRIGQQGIEMGLGHLKLLETSSKNRLMSA